MIQDPAVSVRQLLLDDQQVDNLVSGRVFVGDLPESETAHMPRACVVIRDAGGLGIRSYQPYQNPRYDLFCYGADRYEAGEVDRAVWEVLHFMDRVVKSGTLLHSAVMFGKNLFKTGDTGWPVAHRACTVTAGTTQA